MTSMTIPTTRVVIGGVDTHGQTHHAAMIDEVGQQLDDRGFPASPAGYRALAVWLGEHGTPSAIGVEGPGTYGAGLARYLRTIGLSVVEVDRPDRKSRRARASPTLSTPMPPPGLSCRGRGRRRGCRSCGMAASKRSGRCARPRSSAVKARSQATNQIKALIISGPSELREQLRHVPTARIIAGCARLRPSHQLGDPEQATKTALRRLARRHQQISEEISDADHDITQLVAEVAPNLLTLAGVGPELAGQLLTSAGDNPDRITSEAAFAHLCGVALVPASSGRVRRHRLNRAGDRHANNALYIVVLNRLRYDPRSRAYVEHRTQEGLSKPEIIRCLKRYVAREIYRVLVPAPTAQNLVHSTS